MWLGLVFSDVTSPGQTSSCAHDPGWKAMKKLIKICALQPPTQTETQLVSFLWYYSKKRCEGVEWLELFSFGTESANVSVFHLERTFKGTVPDLL